MRDNVAVKLKDVSKDYFLYKSPRQMLLHMLGIYKFLPGFKEDSIPKFSALANINLEIKRGERLGIVGRNGSGKTTLLKLITQNFKHSYGEIAINGKVQSLMDAGVGFHPDFTGRENIKASLVYNGLSGKEIEYATKDILDFVELGEFIDQPVKTYSLGMQARLGFATSTAIKPDILIVDEVLGAGDAYFLAKSAERMKNITQKGTTLILVSHSQQQILQFCETAVWLHQGKIKAHGPSLDVCKMYDKYIRDLDEKRLSIHNLNVVEEHRGDQVDILEASRANGTDDEAQMVESRWEGVPGLKIARVELVGEGHRPRTVFDLYSKMTININIKATESGLFPCKYHVYIYTLDGNNVSLYMSDVTVKELKKDEEFLVSLQLDRLLLGNGEYVVTVGLYKSFEMSGDQPAEIYDLIDRSFKFRVQSSFSNDYSMFHHPAKWIDGSVELKNYDWTECPKSGGDFFLEQP